MNPFSSASELFHALVSTGCLWCLFDQKQSPDLIIIQPEIISSHFCFVSPPCRASGYRNIFGHPVLDPENVRVPKEGLIAGSVSKSICLWCILTMYGCVSWALGKLLYTSSCHLRSVPVAMFCAPRSAACSQTWWRMRYAHEHSMHVHVHTHTHLRPGVDDES